MFTFAVKSMAQEISETCSKNSFGTNCFVFIADLSTTQYMRVEIVFLEAPSSRNLHLPDIRTNTNEDTHEQRDRNYNSGGKSRWCQNSFFRLTKGHKLHVETHYFRSNTFPSPAEHHICMPQDFFSSILNNERLQS